VSEQTKHDNRAVWGGLDAATVDLTWDRQRDILHGLDACGKPFAGKASIARGLCSAISDAFGVEVHAAGTDAKLRAAEVRVADLEAALAEERSVAEVLRVGLRRLHVREGELRREAAEPSKRPADGAIEGRRAEPEMPDGSWPDTLRRYADTLLREYPEAETYARVMRNAARWWAMKQAGTVPRDEPDPAIAEGLRRLGLPETEPEEWSERVRLTGPEVQRG